MWQRPCARRPASSRTHSPRPRSRKATAHRCAPHAETLEGRQLLTSISELPLQAAGALPVAMTKGPGGQMWFIEQASNLIASIDPVTPAIHTTAIPTAAAYASGITIDPAGRIWFTEERVGRIGVLDPSS